MGCYLSIDGFDINRGTTHAIIRDYFEICSKNVKTKMQSLSFHITYQSLHSSTLQRYYSSINSLENFLKIALCSLRQVSWRENLFLELLPNFQGAGYWCIEVKIFIHWNINRNKNNNTSWAIFFMVCLVFCLLAQKAVFRHWSKNNKEAWLPKFSNNLSCLKTLEININVNTQHRFYQHK